MNIRTFAIRLTGALTAVLGLGACGGGETQGMKEVKVDQLNDLLRHDSSLLLIDVRTRAEYEAVHALPVKRLIEYTEIADSVSHLPANRETPIYLICRSGRRSGIAARALAGLGYRNVYNVAGGTNAWVKAGLPTGSGRGILSPADP